ncbi:lytic transglycosylase domain-containing protein [Amphibiibacter pelophylacis]|uniref:Lytic transglycosylase domain-containing protein n=1 Tax=Amphibiibacter pelophylacis TaxID=1799477 RepID=A0ACC6P4Y4_9BURK
MSLLTDLPSAATDTPLDPLSRRRLLGGALRWSLGAGLLPLAAGAQAQYGYGGKGQAEEPLGNAVRTALSAAVSNGAPPVPVLPTPEMQAQYGRWFAAMNARLQGRMDDDLDRQDFLATVWYESRRAGLEIALVLGLIQVESAFRKYAVSSVGARGYMQVMPFWMRLIGNGDVSLLFRMQTNLRFGCVILRHYIDRENGDLFMALGRYNGSRGRSAYPDAVFGARQRWIMPA